MTLLEILRQELPKRGGWPEGAAKAASYRHIPGVHFWDDNGFRVDYSDLTTRALGEEKITREQYEATGWDGTGLPPVGVECEYSLNGGKTWWKCKVDYMVGTQGVVMLCDTFEGVQYVQFSSYGNALKFRPLRTEAERAIDEMVRLSGVSIGAAKILYDAGYRKG